MFFKKKKAVTSEDKKQVEPAVDKAIEKYIQARRSKIHGFVDTYFSFKGALRLHKKALSGDLIKGSINIFWALPYTGLKAGTSLFKKAGNQKIQALFEKVPRGFETNVQKEVTWLIYTELLEIPYVQGKRISERDALMEEILDQPYIAAMFIEALSKINEKSKDPNFRKVLEKNLQEYSSSRTAAADLAASIITLSVGATVFKQMTPGSIATGTALATMIAQQAAISNFFLGSTLGSFYYSIFPVSASMGLIAATTGTIMAAMAIVTSFTGIITDPIQAKLGIHHKRLNKFIDSLEQELTGAGTSKFEIKDQYVARVFDILDILKTAALTMA